jgi:anti-sigma regulatory factor (Ser/Thr protein kinase)
VDVVLIPGWLDEEPAIPVLDTASLSVVRDRVRAEGKRQGLPSETTAKLVNVASELATNQLAHAHAGVVSVAAIERDGVPGVEVRAADRGPGIGDPASALRGGHSTRGTLGIGLAAVAELAREVDVDVRLGEGTCIRARSFAGDVSRAREVGVLSRACEGERVSGDGALVRRTKRGFVAIVVDGLGHGEEARDATVAALEAGRNALDADAETILRVCHSATAATRGVAMTIAAIDEAGAMTLAGVGNVMAYVVGPRRAVRFTGAPGVVGAPGPLRKIAVERLTVSPYDAVLLFSDGLTSRATLEDDRGLLGQPPIVVAQRMLERFGRENDDAIVLAAL